MLTIQLIDDPGTAAVLLKDPRRALLEMAREPVSAVEMAERLGEARQRIGYHVRCLTEAGLLLEEEVGRRGAMRKKRYRASADRFALAPGILGPLAARLEDRGDRESLAHLLGAVHEVQSDLATVLQEAGAEARLPTLTLSSRIRFLDPAQRGAFAGALARALTQVVADHSAPFEAWDGAAGDGDPFRLTLTLHPTHP